MNLYLDQQNRRMLTGLTSLSELGQPLLLVLRDSYPAQLRLCLPQSVAGKPFAVSPLTAGYSIRFEAKLEADLAGAGLITQNTWTETNPGADVYYAADLPLDGAALITAVEAAGTLDLLGEFTFERADGKHENSTQLDIRVLLDVYRGTEP